MFNNTALNVAIGLVFIFLVYSLISTTINEFISTLFAYRPRMLERAIEQMTDGKNYRYFWWDKLINFFIYGSYWMTASCVRRRAKKPRITNRKKTTKRPAFPWQIGLGDFVLKKHPLNKGTYLPSYLGKLGIHRHKIDAKAKLLAAEITEHPLYRRLASGGVVNKKPAYMPADTFSDILLDILSPHPGKPALLSEIAAEVDRRAKDNRDPLNKEFHRVLRIYFDQANGDYQRFKLLIEDWYNKSMDRVTGWYKQQTQFMLFFIGLGIAIAFNIDSIAISRVLAKDEKARDGIVQMALHDKDNLRIAADVDQPQDPASKQRVDHAYDMLQENTSQAASILGLGRPYNDTCEQCEAFLAKVCKGALSPTDPVIAQRIVYCKRFRETYEHRNWLQYTPYQTGGVVTIAGFLLTALAISLGAPFWFDLLSKLVRIRFAGNKPDSKANDNTDAAKTAGLNKSPDPTAIG